MSYTVNELRAIAWYAQEMDAVPQLSAKPLMRFKRKNGESLQEDLQVIVTRYQRRRNG